MFADGSRLFLIATYSLALGPEFNSQWNWSSGTVAGRPPAATQG